MKARQASAELARARQNGRERAAGAGLGD
jgi:hypothetical protein